LNRRESPILIVDDDASIRRLLVECLTPRYTCVTASTAQEAIKILTANPLDLVLSDITMPKMSGLELCQVIHKTFEDTVVIMVSGQTEIAYAIEAMRLGAFDYITKPFDVPHVLMAVERALKHRSLLVAKKRYEDLLEQTVCRRTAELRRVNDNLNELLEVLYSNYRSTLRCLAEALEARDCETRGHSDRVVAYCLRLGKELGLSPRDLIGLEQGALLHDIGKIGIRDAVLLKAGPLTELEWVDMRGHIDYGLRIIGAIDFLSGARPVVGQHHEKYDGSGYPRGLRGEEIHINARIFAVADAFDAITSDRPYRSAAPYDHARQEITSNSGTHFDPEVVEVFLRIPEAEWAEIRRTAQVPQSPERVIDKDQIHSFIASLKQLVNGADGDPLLQRQETKQAFQVPKT
jgi:response regulator RpfG family c-di-GMP phosphodiesterase